MRAYMVSGDEPCEGAVLVFAKTARRAKKIGFGFLDWEDDWIHVKARWMKDCPKVLTAFDTDEEKCVDSPPSCDRCFLWGYEITKGVCVNCLELEEEDRE